MSESDIVRLLVEVGVIIAAIGGFGLRVGAKIEGLRGDIALATHEQKTLAAALASARADHDRLATEARDSHRAMWSEITEIKSQLAVLRDRNERERGH